MKNITFLLLLFLTFSCDLDTPSDAVLDSTIYLSLENKEGASMLYKEVRDWEVDIYYKIADDWERIDQGGRFAYPEQFGFEVHVTGDTLMKLFLNHYETPSLTVIDWGDGLFDTIKAEYSMGSNHTILERAFHQGEQIPYDTDRKMTLLTLVRE